MKKSKSGWWLLNRSICAVNSVEFGSAPTTSYLMPCLSSTGSRTSRPLCPPSVFSNMTATFLNPAAAIQSPYLVAIRAWFEKTDGGQSGRDVLLPVLDKHGIKYEVVGADPNSTEFTAQIERFKSHQPLFDFFMTFYSEAGAYPLVSQSHTLGFAPTARTGMANSGGPAVDPTFWKNVGQAGRYLVTELVGLPKNAWNDKTKAFVTGFKKKYNDAPSPQAIENYDAMLVLADAIQRAKSTDGKALIAALEKTDIVLGRGRYTFSTSREPDWAYHQFMNAPVALLQFDKTNQDADDATII